MLESLLEFDTVKIIIIFVTLSTCIAVGQVSPIIASKEEAIAHVLKKVDPVVPPLAKITQVGGVVVLSIIISPEGKVTSANAVSGPPMLVEAAIDAVKQWVYKPFENGGRPVPAKAQVEVSFPGGRSKAEEEINERYFKSEHECRALLNAKKYDEGETKCRESVTLSDALPQDAILERSDARSLLAHTIFLQGRVADAIPVYADALKLDQSYLKDNDADLASNYANLGRAYAKTGDLGKADSLYAISVKTFKAAIRNLPDMKENYTARLKRTLKEYAQIKLDEGQNVAAEQLGKEADALTP